MIIFGLIVLFIIVFIFFYRKKKSIQKTEPVVELKITNVGKGTALSFTGIGPELLDFDAIVEKRHTYREGSLEWFELECMAGGDTYWLEIYPGEDMELSITYRKLSLKDINVSADELYKIDENESGTLTFNNVEYSYVDSGDAVYLEDSQEEKTERFYYWDFESKDMRQYCNIEKWRDGKFDVSLAEPVKESQITIYS
jgi:hypothetical protein